MAFLERVASLAAHGEERDGETLVMEGDDAVTTLSELIRDARSLRDASSEAGR